jgi:hypothetical protein
MSSNSIFVFMAGDNNLDPAGVDDIQEICRADPPSDLKVIIQFDRSRDPGETGNGEATKRFIVENSELVELQDLGETNCGDPEVLSEFLEWGMQEYPALRNMAVIWNHGGGAKDEDVYRAARGKNRNLLFVPKGERTTVSARTARKAAAGRQAGAGRRTPRKPAPVKFICADDTSRDFLDNIELKAALAHPGKKFDIVGFDACLMNMVEVIYQIRDIADVVIGSEEVEPGAGWPYEAIVSYLKTHQRVNNAELAKEIVALYDQSYADSGDTVTQSAISTGALAGAAQSLDDLAGLLRGSLDEIRPALAKILSSVQRYEDRDYIDLYDFALLCEKNIGARPIGDAASRLLPGLDKTIIASMKRGSSVQNSHGLSIYFPLEKPTDEILAIYRKLDFSVEYPNWLGLITAFHASSDLRR